MNNEAVIRMLYEIQMAGIWIVKIFIKEPYTTGEFCS